MTRPRLWRYIGWSTDVYTSQGLTWEGIEEVLRILKIQATVAESFDVLKHAISQVKDKAAIITSHGAIKYGTVDNHAVSLFVQKVGDETRLFINDSGGVDYNSCYLNGDRVRLFVSKVKRQGRYEVTCNAFAIYDCIAFQGDPNLLEKIAALDGDLPPAMRALDTVEKARSKALEYQILLIEKVFNERLVKITWSPFS